MLFSKRMFVPFALLVLPAAPTLADTAPSAAPVRVEIRISTNLSTSTSLDPGDPVKSAAAQSDARKTLYEVIGRECALRNETIARECRIESISVNSNVQLGRDNGFPGSMHGGTMQIGANATFRVILRDPGTAN